MDSIGDCPRRKEMLDYLPARLYLQLRWWRYRMTRPESYQQLQALRGVDTSSSQSLKPFDDTRSIFVHIPKCAGISVSKMFYGNQAGGHTTLQEYACIFAPHQLLGYFKFTIVRNPWDRLVSAYHFLRNGGFSRQDAEWFRSELAGFGDFDAFVKGWLNERNIWKWFHFRPQYHYICDPANKISLDFIGFIENLEEDLQLVGERLGKNARLPNMNRGQHLDYKEYYTRESRDIVAEVYQRDIRMLGYRFDNSSLQEQIAHRNAA